MRPAMHTPTYRLTLAYDGALFHGAATQPGLRTVSSELHAWICAACGQAPSSLRLAARTDRGVHARGAVTSFRLAGGPPAAVLWPLLKASVPSGLRPVHLQQVPHRYHARASATARHYRYRVLHHPQIHPRAWSVHPVLARAPMEALAALLTGTRCFAALAHPTRRRGNTVCTLQSVTLAQRGALLRVDVVGSRFLRQMVRRLVGTLTLVGAGLLSVEEAAHALDAGCAAGVGNLVAPARGLHLIRVWDDL